ncbi:MAG: OmpA family protein [Alphaproteobacteria bacterium]|nr:OmpA family protein [Alphaproteobacteria bacterium]
MKINNSVSILTVLAALGLAGCAGTYTDNVEVTEEATPTVDFIEQIDVHSSKYKDSFLHQLAMNYRSYAIYNAQESGFSDIGELFAQKAVTAFSGEVPYPENLDDWEIQDEDVSFAIYTAYNQLMDALQNDASATQPILSAEAQAKFDCWISAAASGQEETAEECEGRFKETMATLADCGKGEVPVRVKSETIPAKTETYYPETRRLTATYNVPRGREGIIIVNNITVPAQQPVVVKEETKAPALGEEYVSRAEFINMMVAMRAELADINNKLNNMPAPAKEERTIIKVQQLPLEPQQHIMEEIFEIRFDFDKSNIKPEYEEIIRKLATTTQANKNIKVSVVGHTDTAGSNAYNYALGGRRAEAVRKKLISYGIPSSQIVAVSAGEEDLKVLTPDNTPNAENRRVRVVKEVHYTEPAAKPAPIIVEQYEATDDCTDCEEVVTEESVVEEAVTETPEMEEEK